MATLVCFHAHPDDESISTAGVMAKAADDGHRVVLVVATRGELGEVADGFLDEGESLAERRVVETHAAADVLGVSRVEFLGYRDSGMAGLPTNDEPGAFAAADVEEAAERLAAILRDEAADVVTIYDANGTYGHPDHIQVHRVGRRAAELAGTARVYEATANRDHIAQGMTFLREQAEQDDAVQQFADEVESSGEEFDLGVPESQLTTAVDVSPWIDKKRQAMVAHASQITEDSFFLRMPPAAFSWAFGTEWFIRVGTEPGLRETSLFD
jgi:LmbE family N-acetylglucosaminyl deacetylase